MVVRRPEVLRSFLESEQARLQAVVAQAEAEGSKNLGYGNHMADDATASRLGGPGMSGSWPAGGRTQATQDHVPGEIVVKLNEEGDLSAVADELFRRGLPFATIAPDSRLDALARELGLSAMTRVFRTPRLSSLESAPSMTIRQARAARAAEQRIMDQEQQMQQMQPPPEEGPPIG